MQHLHNFLTHDWRNSVTTILSAVPPCRNKTPPKVRRRKVHGPSPAVWAWFFKWRRQRPPARTEDGQKSNKFVSNRARGFGLPHPPPPTKHRMLVHSAFTRQGKRPKRRKDGKSPFRQKTHTNKKSGSAESLADRFYQHNKGQYLKSWIFCWV